LNSNGSETLAVPLDNVNTIFFDFGDTLGEITHSVLETWLAAAAEHGLVLQQDALLEALKAADKVCSPKVYEYKGRMPEYWGIYDAFVLNKLGVSDRDGDLSRMVGSAFLDAKKWLRVFPETHSVLSKLKQRGYVLGIISNNTDEIFDRMKSLDLVRYFDTITYSQEAGAEKPDFAPFKLALSRAGRAPHECLHVGDSYEMDVVGARGVGIEPVLVDRKMRRSGTDCVIIRNLNGILNES
jgi:HAD superfamily hydrolase (TIGR01509 family)